MNWLKGELAKCRCVFSLLDALLYKGPVCLESVGVASERQTFLISKCIYNVAVYVEKFSRHSYSLGSLYLKM